MRSPLAGIARLLVVLPSWVGDAVMATPALRALRESLAGARIELMGRPGLEAVLAGLPTFDAFHTHDMRGWLGPFTGAGRFRAMRFDAVLLLPNSPRSGLFALATGARMRLGWARDGRGWMLTHGLTPPKDRSPRSAVDWYADLAAWALQRPVTDRVVALGCTDEQREAGARLLEGLPRPITLLNPGANREDKRWPAERFGELARRLLAARGGTVCVTGGPAEREVVERVVKASGDAAVNLIDRGVTLGSLKTAIGMADLLVTNDTGPRHLAAGMGTRCVSLFGPTDPRWAALHEGPGARRELQLLAEPFLPKELVADRLARFCAMQRIGVGDVEHACLRLLAR
ncbi:MAG: glycosyltransferase family 9 protein [Planctomycetota bacterium]